MTSKEVKNVLSEYTTNFIFQNRKTNCVVALHFDLADLPQLCRQLVARISYNMNQTLFHKSKEVWLHETTNINMYRTQNYTITRRKLNFGTAWIFHISIQWQEQALLVLCLCLWSSPNFADKIFIHCITTRGLSGWKTSTETYTECWLVWQTVMLFICEFLFDWTADKFDWLACSWSSFLLWYKLNKHEQWKRKYSSQEVYPTQHFLFFFFFYLI